MERSAVAGTEVGLDVAEEIAGWGCVQTSLPFNLSLYPTKHKNGVYMVAGEFEVFRE